MSDARHTRLYERMRTICTRRSGPFWISDPLWDRWHAWTQRNGKVYRY